MIPSQNITNSDSPDSNLHHPTKLGRNLNYFINVSVEWLQGINSKHQH